MRAQAAACLAVWLALPAGASAAGVRQESPCAEAGGWVAWSERLASSRAEDLDGLAVRLAGRAAAATPRRRGPAIDRRAEAEDGAPPAEATPKRRGWASSGPRAAVGTPIGRSWAGAERLTSLAWVWRYETPSWSAECTPALGLTWGGDLERDGGKGRDWTLLDVFLAWTPGGGDVSPWGGAGIGLHAVRLEREGTGLPFSGRRDESATTLGLALGAGLTFFRTYDFQIGVDLRYQRLLYDFPEVGGGGVQALVLGFGIQHR